MTIRILCLSFLGLSASVLSTSFLFMCLSVISTQSAQAGTIQKFIVNGPAVLFYDHLSGSAVTVAGPNLKKITLDSGSNQSLVITCDRANAFCEIENFNSTLGSPAGSFLGSEQGGSFAALSLTGFAAATLYNNLSGWSVLNASDPSFMELDVGTDVSCDSFKAAAVTVNYEKSSGTLTVQDDTGAYEVDCAGG